MRALALLVLAACGPSFGPPPEPNQYFRSSMRTSCEDGALVALANEASVDADALVAMGVTRRGAQNLIEARAAGVIFTSAADIDAITGIGKVSIAAMHTANAGLCDFVVDPEYACMETTVTEFVSASSTTVEDLKDLGLPTRGAKEIVKARDGDDRLPGTVDDVRFGSLDDVDRVPQVGEQTLADLLAWGLSQCQTQADVVFSPQEYENSHLSRVIEVLDRAERSADIAMYSLSDSGVKDAITRAADRGIQVRAILQKASEDRRDPEGTLSARFEDHGIEVRWINRIMHHKYLLVDGARDHVSQAGTGLLLTGSGNWSNGAGTRFDENTLVVRGDAKLNLQFQREFETMWTNGRPVIWNEALVSPPGLSISDRDIASADGAQAVFTSDNFEPYEHTTYGPTFGLKDDSSVAEDALVQLIAQADESVWIASGHLRSRRVFDALATKHFVDPEVDIKVYLDGQEFVDQEYHETELLEHQTCLDEAVDEDDFEDCARDGYYFGAALANLGIDVRYKYYAYRWNYRYADQMHHKYIVIDNEIVATGSYNLSPNAEYATLENIVVLHKGQYRSIVSRYEDNFEGMWATERDSGLLDSLMNSIENTNDPFSIVFEPMALTHTEVSVLKATILEHCPEVDSEAFRSDPGGNLVCER